MTMKKRKETLLLFLDIDGVLNTEKTFNTNYRLLGRNLDVFAALLTKLDKAGYLTRVILSSTWRYGYETSYEACSVTVQRLIRELGKRDIGIAGKTVYYPKATRDREIMRYIREYGREHVGFKHLTLDDDLTIFSGEGAKNVNLYLVNSATGLTEGDIPKILKQIKDIDKYRENGIN